ncbi:SRR1-like protein-related protein [Tritrichomonas foetus]|uniref:SRR1-like protein-related protein n=1 Tax=Tritrichomonas foetus TaxID=1144522 RepID=A0A1J4JY54_9EUKA|nr:SRR1-like protein-related protein [Tritrichomonas foetus]|eukprot:OHT02205.1 SRR1-like protein-related protein [Tritrichomonas foetus]
MSRRKKKSGLSIPIVNVCMNIEEIETNINEMVVTNFPAFQIIIDNLNNHNIQKLYCIGIGDLCKSSAARLQTALILKAAHSCSITDLFYYDPVLCENCKNIITKLGFQCGQENPEGCYTFQEKVAFFMPHCPRFIYHNLLVTNWNPLLMKNMFIIGNSFSMYEEKYRMFLQKTKTAVEDIFSKGIIDEVSLDFLKNEFFDSTSIMMVNEAKLKEIEESFWEKREILHDAPDAAQ